MTVSLVQKIWFKLDESIDESLAWSNIGKNKNHYADDQDDYVRWLEDRVAFLEGPANAGRGLAEALVILCTPAFDKGGADAVIALAMRRWQARQDNDMMPQTPGFMGPGVSGNDLRLAGAGEVKEQTDKFSDAHRKAKGNSK